MEHRLWAYHNEFGWFAVDPEECDFDEDKVDEAPAVLEATTKHELMNMAEADNIKIVMWLE
jgi:hypothetical protein